MKKLYLLFALIAAATLAACHGTEEPAGPQTVASIVTFDGTDNSGISTFSYSDAEGDSVKLYAAWTAPDDRLKPGNRALIYYQANDYGVSAQVQLTAVMPIPSGKAEIAAASDIHRGEPLSQARVWRSGRWLNLASVVTFSGDAKEISLLAEATTLSRPTVDVYIVVGAAPDSRPSAQRQLFATWNIGDLLDDPGCEGINVFYTAPNNELKSILIKK